MTMSPTVDARRDEPAPAARTKVPTVAMIGSRGFPGQPGGVERVLEEQTRGTDMVLGVPVVFGMGFGLNDPTFPISPNPRSFFWGGWGGSLAIVDLDARVSIAYVMNHMAASLVGDQRGGSIAMAVYQSLAALSE